MPTSLGSGLGGGHQYASFASPPSCNYQQILSDFNGMLLSFDCSDHQLGNFLNVRRSVKLPDKLIERSAGKAEVSKRVFIGELNELQFRTKAARPAGPGQKERPPISSAPGTAAALSEQGVAAKANETVELMKPPNMANPIMLRLRDGLRNMIDSSKEAQLKQVDKKRRKRGSGDSAGTSSEESDNPLDQDAGQAQNNGFANEAQLRLREHELLISPGLVEDCQDVPGSWAHDEDDKRHQASPWTSKLNLDLLRKDADAQGEGQDLRLFMDKINFLYKLEAPRKELSLNSLKMMFTQGPSVKKIRKLTADQMHDIIKEKSKRVRDEVYTKASHLMLVNQTSHLQPLEPMKEMVIDLKPISAVFLKLNVSGRRPPLVAVFQHMADEQGHNKGQADGAAKERGGVQVFWSHTNPFPCCGRAEDNDGGFTQEKVMKIAAQGELRFPQPHVYLAIYARTATFKDQLMYSFGAQAEKTIE